MPLWFAECCIRIGSSRSQIGERNSGNTSHFGTEKFQTEPAIYQTCHYNTADYTFQTLSKVPGT